jgi:hypothetical protein
MAAADTRPDDPPPVDAARLCSAEQATAGRGMTMPESFAINAAGHDARLHVVAAHFGKVDTEILDRAIDDAVRVARLTAAATILRANPRSLVSLPRIPTDRHDEAGPPESWGAEADEVWTLTRPPLPVATLYPLDGPQPRRDDRHAEAHENGYQVGYAGWEVDEVSPPEVYNAGEANSFTMGIEAGSRARWREYGRFLDLVDAMNRLDDPHGDVHDAELAENGSAVGHDG